MNVCMCCMCSHRTILLSIILLLQYMQEVANNGLPGAERECKHGSVSDRYRIPSWASKPPATSNLVSMLQSNGNNYVPGMYVCGAKKVLRRLHSVSIGTLPA